jgi:hypothetical protein
LLDQPRRAVAEQAGSGQPLSIIQKTPRRPVGLLTHDVFDKTVKGRNLRARLTPSKETCAMDIPRRYVTVFMKWSTEALD